MIGLVFGGPILSLLVSARVGWEVVPSVLLILGCIVAFSMLIYGFYNDVLFYIGLALAALSAAYIFVPTWVMDYEAKTPDDHLRVAQAYEKRGVIFKDEKASWKHFLIAAQGGNAEAQFNVGAGYLYGWYGVDRDKEQARHWMKAAADQGYQKAQDDLPDVDKASF